MEATQTIASEAQNEPSIPVTLLCRNDNTQHHCYVHIQQTVEELLEHLLQKLEVIKGTQYMVQMLECYEPVLERLSEGVGIPLNNEQSLEEANISAGNTLQIAAKPRKEKLLFCRYSN